VKVSGSLSLLRFVLTTNLGIFELQEGFLSAHLVHSFVSNSPAM